MDEYVKLLLAFREARATYREKPTSENNQAFGEALSAMRGEWYYLTDSERVAVDAPENAYMPMGKMDRDAGMKHGV